MEVEVYPRNLIDSPHGSAVLCIIVSVERDIVSCWIIGYTKWRPAAPGTSHLLEPTQTSSTHSILVCYLELIKAYKSFLVLTRAH